jgi:hypothetical protein
MGRRLFAPEAGRAVWFAALTIGAIYFGWQCLMEYRGVSLALPGWYLAIVLIQVARATHEQTIAIRAKERALRDLIRVIGRSGKG